jgi:hypothetical protein
VTSPSGDGLLTRAEVLKLLSQGEIWSANTAEAKTHLRLGDLYLDLEHLQLGVQRSDGTTIKTNHILPRKAIHEDTWRRILRQLKAIPT